MKYLKIFLVAMIIISGCKKTNSSKIILEKWKFKTGDNLEWAKPEFDDSAWDTIIAGQLWENQGYTDYDGYAWYRVKFKLPSELKNSSALKDSLQLYLAKIDDTDETFINGILFSKNGRVVGASDTIKFESQSAYSWLRNFLFPLNTDVLKWDEENTIAIRVHDGGGGGGIWDGTPSIGLLVVSDYLIADLTSKFNAVATDSNAQSTVILKNTSWSYNFKGKLSILIENKTANTVVSKNEFPFEMKPRSDAEFTYNTPKLDESKYETKVICEETNYGTLFERTIALPYILTPKSGEKLRINGPKVTAARPGKPFLFRLPVTGKRPIEYKAEGLPVGLKIDASTGIISGSVKDSGTYVVKISVKNELSDAQRDLKIVIGDRLCLTPPMGYNSWNCWGLSVDENKMKSSIDVFIKKGLADHGWAFVNIDDGWEAAKRLSNGNITPNEKFGSIKELADYAHSNGLKLGIYSSPGPTTCGGYLASYTFEKNDAQTYASWGIDYLKYDWCSYGSICKNASDLNELKKPYILMDKELRATNRDIVYSLCQYGMGNVSSWGGSVGGQLWRTTGDINDSWGSLSGIGFQQQANAPYAKPGNWNDPDMLVVGYVGWGPSVHPSRLTADEQYTHISLWCLLSAPLLIGCDLSRLDDFTLNLLTNDEVLEIDQDPLGKQAVPVIKTNDYQIYVKELENGSKAIGLFNLSNNELEITAIFDKLQLSEKQSVRNLWTQKDLGIYENSFAAKVPSHGVVLVKVTKN